MNPVGALFQAAPAAKVGDIKHPKIDRRVLALKIINSQFSKELFAQPIKPADAEAFIRTQADKATKAPASPLRPKSPETL